MVRTVRRAVRCSRWWPPLLVSVGLGRHKPSDVGAVIAARDRSAAPSPAPPHGLVLWAALYDRSVEFPGSS